MGSCECAPGAPNSPSELEPSAHKRTSRGCRSGRHRSTSLQVERQSMLLSEQLVCVKAFGDAVKDVVEGTIADEETTQEEQLSEEVKVETSETKLPDHMSRTGRRRATRSNSGKLNILKLKESLYVGAGDTEKSQAQILDEKEKARNDARGQGLQHSKKNCGKSDSLGEIETTECSGLLGELPDSDGED